MFVHAIRRSSETETNSIHNDLCATPTVVSLSGCISAINSASGFGYCFASCFWTLQDLLALALRSKCGFEASDHRVPGFFSALA